MRRVRIEVVLGKVLSRIGSWLYRTRLRWPRFFTGHIGWRRRYFLDWKQWFSSFPVEEENISLLGHLGDSVNFLSVVRDGEQVWRSRCIAIEYIVVDKLKMPYPFTCLCIQRKQRIREKVAAYSIATVKVERSRPGRNVDDSTFTVNCHTGPIVGRPYSCVFMSAFRPCVVAELTGSGYRLEYPGKFTCDDVEGLDVSRRRVGALRQTQRHDDQVFVYSAWCSRLHVFLLCRLSQSCFQTRFATITEGRYYLSRHRINRIKPLATCEKYSLVVPALPIRYSAYDLTTPGRVGYAPKLFSCCRIEGEWNSFGGCRIEPAVYDDRIALHLSAVTGMEFPRHLQLRDVIEIDLRQRRIVIAVRTAEILLPVRFKGRTSAARDQQGSRKQETERGKW